MDSAALGTRQKTLALNLDARTYGAFAEMIKAQHLFGWQIARTGLSA